MSQKQLRKLRELRGNPKSLENQQAEDGKSPGSESSDDQAPAPAAGIGFHALVSSESSSEEAQVPVVKPQQRSRKKGPAVPGGSRKPKASDDDLLDGFLEEAPQPETPDQASSISNPMAMRRVDFSGEAERQRVFGRTVNRLGETRRKGPQRMRGQGEGKTLHHRRLFLVSLAANEPWPKPDDTSQMQVTLSEDGAVSFDFTDTEASKRSLDMLQSVVSQEDPELLQRYLQRSPFSLEGLLVMAEHHRRQGGHDQARELVRRAVYAVECAFAPDFSPFDSLDVGSQASRPRVRLKMPDAQNLEWPGWSWLRAVWMHMHCLAGQGMHRTSLEVCKLLVASTLPRDPVRGILWLDYLCLRSRQYKLIPQLSMTVAATCGQDSKDFNLLEVVFPNFAFSVALAGILQQRPDMSVLQHLTLEQILKLDNEKMDNSADLLTFARLMRALLYFPGAVRPLLEEASVPLDAHGSDSWRTLLTAAPFVDALSYRHAEHAAAQGRLCAAYAKLCGPLWKDEPLKVMHACAMRWVKLHESEIFRTEIVEARVAWANATFYFSETLLDYQDVLPDDGLANPPVPLLLEHALSARVHPKKEQQVDAGMFRRTDAVPNMSIYTPPLILFFQSLMPWSVLDQSGVTATPLLWKDIGRGLAAAFRDTLLFVREAAVELWHATAAMLQQHFWPQRATR